MIACVQFDAPPVTRNAWEAAFHAMRDYARKVEPLPDADPPCAYLDMGRLHPQAGQDMALDLLKRLHEHSGLYGRIGLAAGKFPAGIAASGRDPVGIIVPQHAAQTLAPLSTKLLPLDKETARRFGLFGLRRMGQVTALSKAAMFQQFGRPGVVLRDLAQGVDPRPVVDTPLPRVEVAAQQFGAPVDDLAVMQAVCEAMARDLVARMDRDKLAANTLTLTLHFDDRTHLNEAARPRDPITGCKDVSLLAMGMMRGLIRQQDGAQGITGMEIALSDFAEAVPVQMNMFDYMAGRYHLEAALARAAKRHGENAYRPLAAEPESLLLERRFRLENVSA